jgi:hypothetical protein
MNLKAVIALLVVALATGMYVGKTMFPAVKTVEVEKEVQSNNVVTVTREVIKPDGTKVLESTVTDKTKLLKEASKVVVVGKPNWHISGGVERNGLTAPNVYSLQVERRVLGELFLGVKASSDSSVGVVVGYSF